MFYSKTLKNKRKNNSQKIETQNSLSPKGIQKFRRH